MYEFTKLRVRPPLRREAEGEPTPAPKSASMNSTQPWLVFTLQRSGSRWFVDTLDERSGGLVFKNSGMEIKCGASSGCACHDVGSNDTRAVSTCINGLGAGFRDRGSHPGFKFMAPYGSLKFMAPYGPAAFSVLAQAVCRLEVSFLFMWRRNVLRRIISNFANQRDTDHPALGAHQAHPTNNIQVIALRAYKPRLDASKLVRMIESERKMQHSIEIAFAQLAPNCDGAARTATFYYEDLLDANENSSAAWETVMQILRIPPGPKITRHKTHQVIHGDLPVLQTVANPGDVARALNATPHAWMLWA